MILPPPLLLISDDAFDTSVPAPQYTEDFHSTVGDAGTDSDGFNELINPIVSYGDTGPAVLGELDSHLGELDTHAPGLGIEIEGEAVQSYNDAVRHGQPGIDDFQSLKTASRGRVYAGGIFTWLVAQNGQEFGPHANVDQNAAELGIFAQLGFKQAPVLGEPVYPTKWWVRTKAGVTPEIFVKAELITDNPVFDRLWHDDFTAVQTGADWHFYVDINPVQVGVHCCTVRLYQDETHYRAMTLQVYVAPDHAHVWHRPPESCAVDPGNPLPAGGGTGGGGGGGTGGSGGGGNGGGGPTHGRLEL